MKYSIYIPIIFLISACNLSPGIDKPSKDLLEVNVAPTIAIEQLSEGLSESSGILSFDGKLWSMNDSGGKNEIYAFDAYGSIITRAVLDGYDNNDWEALTQDEEFVYVGDFGNNKGSRTNLSVLKIPKQELTTGDSVLNITAAKIEFTYTAQTDFSEREYRHEYDCEAMFSIGDQLFLFSKDWINLETTVYRLPKIPGNYDLSAAGSYNVGGLITAADISPDGKIFALLGYQFGFNILQPFIYLFEYTEDGIFSNKSVYINLNAIAGAQTEGICFLKKNELIFSTEKTDSYTQQVFSIDIADYLNHFD